MPIPVKASSILKLLHDVTCLSREEILQLEVDTRGQACNSKWHSERAGTVKSSRACELLCKSNPLTLTRYFTKELAYIDERVPYYGQRSTIASLNHGNMNEDICLQLINEFVVTHEHRKDGMKALKPGLIRLTQYPYVASSPDCYIGKLCSEAGQIENMNGDIFEIKCFTSCIFKDTPTFDGLSWEDIVKHLEDNKKVGKVSSQVMNKNYPLVRVQSKDIDEIVSHCGSASASFLRHNKESGAVLYRFNVVTETNEYGSRRLVVKLKQPVERGLTGLMVSPYHKFSIQMALQRAAFQQLFPSTPKHALSFLTLYICREVTEEESGSYLVFNDSSQTVLEHGRLVPLALVLVPFCVPEEYLNDMLYGITTSYAIGLYKKTCQDLTVEDESKDFNDIETVLSQHFQPVGNPYIQQGYIYKTNKRSINISSRKRKRGQNDNSE